MDVHRILGNADDGAVVPVSLWGSRIYSQWEMGESVKPVYQDRFGSDGNCLEACIATLLDLPLAAVPNLGGDATYEENMAKFLASQGMMYVLVEGPGKIEKELLAEMFKAGDVYHIIEGICNDGAPHAIIGLNGQQDFDPHPPFVQHETGPGLKRVDGWGFIVKRL